MIFQILSPIVASIEGDSLKDAIKNFVKVNHAYQFNNFVLADQINKYNANINYYKQNNKNKIGISIQQADTNNSVGLNVYPTNNLFQPIYQDSENGKLPNVVAMGVKVPLTTVSIPDENVINVKPIVTGPNMISTTDTGVLLTPQLRFLASLYP